MGGFLKKLFLREERIQKYVLGAEKYLERKYQDPSKAKEADAVAKPEKSSDIRYSRVVLDDYEDDFQGNTQSPYDAYNTDQVTEIFRSHLPQRDLDGLGALLENNLNETFVEKTLRLITQKRLSNAKVYSSAQLDRRLFSKIMSDRHYKPSKDTAVAIAMALRLSLDEAKDLLSRAGYTFSHSNKRDIVIEYFFREEVYDLTEINIVLEKLGMKVIGR